MKIKITVCDEKTGHLARTIVSDLKETETAEISINDNVHIVETHHKRSTNILIGKK